MTILQPRTRVAAHYTTEGLEERILAALVAEGKDLEALTVDDLAPVDAFHIRGRAATEELARWVAIQPGDRVLDVGCGLGGTSRFLASTTGCNVVGIELTAVYCEVAERLSTRVGLGHRTAFQQGSALALPFAAGSFDVVWTEHVQMNIADKVGFYQDLARVLKAGAPFAFHDIFAGPKGPIHFPVPWAMDASISHLMHVADLEALLADVGFVPVRWEDKTHASAAFFQQVVRRQQTGETIPLGLHLLMGHEAKAKFSNLLRNLKEGRVRVVQAVMQRRT